MGSAEIRCVPASVTVEYCVIFVAYGRELKLVSHYYIELAGLKELQSV